MTQYGPEFFRKFADIITEAEQVPQQLDEGIIDTIKQKTAGFAEKVKQLPGFAEAYATAKAAVPQLKQIFTTSKSGAEVVDKIKQLAGANKPVAVAETDGDLMIGAGAVGGIATGGLMLWEIGSGLIDAAYAAGGLTGPAGIWFIVMPVVILVYCTGLCIAGATK